MIWDRSMISTSRSFAQCWSLRLLLAIVAASATIATSSAQIILEDFKTRRYNNDTPPELLYHIYQGEDPAQIDGGISNGLWHVTGDTASNCVSGCYTGGGLYWYSFVYPYQWPTGFMQYYIKSGTFTPTVNRLNLKFYCSASLPRQSNGSNTLEIGTYVKPHNETTPNVLGMHYYHQFDFNVYSGHWILLEINKQPQHIVGGPATTVPPYDPEYSNPTYGTPVHYFDGLTTWYFDTQATGPGGTGWSRNDCYFKDIELRQVDNEPDNLVASTTAQYNGTQFEVTWAGPGTGQSYSVYYSRASMHANGLPSGTPAGTVQDPGGYKGVFWQSPSLPLSTGLYVAVQPAGSSTFSEIFVPPMDGAASSANPCDLNNDGVVNTVDVTVAINAVLNNTQTCNNLDGTGTCTVVAVQRVINASLPGGTCRVGS